MKNNEMMNLQLFAGHEAQERYSSLVLAKLRKTTIFTPLFNRRYEGTPTAGAVKIPVRDTEVSVGDYDKSTGGTLGTGTTTYQTLTIDKDKYVNELIDGYDAAAVPDNLVADRLTSDSTSGNTSASAYLPGMYKVKADDLNIRTGPGTGYTVCGVIRDHGACTMTEMKGSWGRLKSGAGWINCHEKYCTYLDGAGTVERRDNPYPVPTRTIRYIKGQPTMKGDDVRWVQWELVEAGYDIEIDGSFGPASGKALLAYQAQHDLEQDGKCGPATRACMRED